MALALGMMSHSVMAKTLNVVTSFSILGDITQEVGGDHVNVTTLVGPDGDPHTFEPSPKDSAALSKADVVVVNGLGLEGWLDRLVKASGFKGQLVVAVVVWLYLGLPRTGAEEEPAAFVAEYCLFAAGGYGA